MRVDESMRNQGGFRGVKPYPSAPMGLVVRRPPPPASPNYICHSTESSFRLCIIDHRPQPEVRALWLWSQWRRFFDLATFGLCFSTAGGLRTQSLGNFLPCLQDNHFSRSPKQTITLRQLYRIMATRSLDEPPHDLTCLTIGELEKIAADKTDKQTRDYYSEGADSGLTLSENTEAYKKYRIRPRVLRDMSAIDTSTLVFGHRNSIPMGVAPTAVRLHEPRNPAKKLTATRCTASRTQMANWLQHAHVAIRM